MSHTDQPIPTDPEAAAQSAPADTDPPGGPGTPSEPERLVPVSEARRYRKRAQAAEKMLDDLRQERDAINAQLEQRNDALARLQRARVLDEALIAANAIDLETARLLAEQAVPDHEEADAAEIVDDLVCRKPFLFRATPARSGALSPHGPGSSAPAPTALEDAALAAGSTGRRTDLLRYLRLKRRP